MEELTCDTCEKPAVFTCIYCDAQYCSMECQNGTHDGKCAEEAIASEQEELAEIFDIPVIYMFVCAIAHHALVGNPNAHLRVTILDEGERIVYYTEAIEGLLSPIGPAGTYPILLRMSGGRSGLVRHEQAAECELEFGALTEAGVSLLPKNTVSVKDNHVRLNQ